MGISFGLHKFYREVFRGDRLSPVYALLLTALLLDGKRRLFCNPKERVKGKAQLSYACVGGGH